jgi:hypothetical protein
MKTSIEKHMLRKRSHQRTMQHNIAEEKAFLFSLFHIGYFIIFVFHEYYLFTQNNNKMSEMNNVGAIIFFFLRFWHIY